MTGVEEKVNIETYILKKELAADFMAANGKYYDR